MVTKAISALLLVACSNKTNSSMLNGTWEKATGEASVCRDSYTFSGENSFQIQNSRIQGGENSSGTYDHVEGNEYQFNYGAGYDTFYIELNNNNTMNVQFQNKDNATCKYEKVK